MVIFFLISGDYSYNRLSYTEETNPTWLAYQLVILLCAVFFLSYSFRLKLLISSPFIVALILTQGKTALLGLIASYLCVYVLRSKHKLTIALSITLLLSAIFISLDVSLSVLSIYCGLAFNPGSFKLRSDNNFLQFKLA